MKPNPTRKTIKVPAADLTATAALTEDGPAPELCIEIWRDAWAEYEGTAAQLIAEGLIPDRFKWPKAATDAYWEVNGFKYWLRRTRPRGHKGPIKSWLELDNWRIRVTAAGRDYHWCARRALARKAEELRTEYHRQPGEVLIRYWAARDDDAFQAFKLLVPGLVLPGRGRKASSEPP